MLWLLVIPLLLGLALALQAGLVAFAIGGQWTENQPVRIDELWIRW